MPLDHLVKVQSFGNYLVPSMVAYNNSEVRRKYLCAYTLLFFMIFLFINVPEYANFIISIHYRWMKLLCLTFIFYRVSTLE